MRSRRPRVLGFETPPSQGDDTCRLGRWLEGGLAIGHELITEREGMGREGGERRRREKWNWPLVQLGAEAFFELSKGCVFIPNSLEFKKLP